MQKVTLDNLRNTAIKTGQLIASHYCNKNRTFALSVTLIDKAFDEYEKTKQAVKNTVSFTDFRADRHKVAAIFVSAIMKSKPIEVVANITETSDEEQSIIVNWNFAAAIASEIIKDFYVAAHGREIAFTHPNESPNNKNYNDQLFALMMCYYKQDMIDSELFVLAMSHIYFLLEKYSIEIKTNK